MEGQVWLALTDYSAKYRISVSTLRRRIKHGTIKFRFEDGRYLLLDTRPTNVSEAQAPLQPVHQQQNQMPSQYSMPVHDFANEHEPHDVGEYMSQPLGQTIPTQSQQPTQPSDEPILSSATRLLSELKRAYMNVLHEKEEQIIQLKAEVSDLKTLVRVLEDDNDRLRRSVGERELMR